MAKRKKRSRVIRKAGNHRQAPRPLTWDSPKGTCRFCGHPIIEDGVQNNRKNWHQPCADIWVIANSPTKARQFVFTRERGTCQGTGCAVKSLNMRDFHVDHIVPLFEAEGELHYYTSANMQLLCHACHKVKTTEDMRRFRARTTP